MGLPPHGTPHDFHRIFHLKVSRWLWKVSARNSQGQDFPRSAVWLETWSVGSLTGNLGGMGLGSWRCRPGNGYHLGVNSPKLGELGPFNYGYTYTIYIYIHIYIYTYIHTYIYIYTYVCMYLWLLVLCIYIYMYVHNHLYLEVHLQVWAAWAWDGRSCLL